MAIDNSRQVDLVPADLLASLKIDVVGVGAIGRQVALQLASIGAEKLRLIDHDKVDASNICTQGYVTTDIGENKCIAVRWGINQINSDCDLRILPIEWDYNTPLSEVVFCCVDNMEVRAELHRESRKGDFFVDGRMLAEVGYVYPVFDENSSVDYLKTLFSSDEAEPGRCTARSTIYGANHVASAMVHQFVRWMRKQAPFSCGGMIGQWQKV